MYRASLNVTRSLPFLPPPLIPSPWLPPYRRMVYHLRMLSALTAKPMTLSKGTPLTQMHPPQRKKAINQFLPNPLSLRVVEVSLSFKHFLHHAELVIFLCKS